MPPALWDRIVLRFVVKREPAQTDVKWAADAMENEVTIDGLQLSAARDELARQQEMRRALSLARDRLAQTEYRLRALESCLTQTGDEIQRLESWGLGSLVTSLLGRKHQNISRKREEEAELQRKYEECAAALESVQQEIRSIEEQVIDPNELEQELHRLHAERSRQIMECGDEAADRLDELQQQLDAAKTYRQRVHKTILVGKHLLERLHSLTGAAGRARTKGINASAVGALTATAVNTVLRNRPLKGSVQRVQGGLEEFALAICELNLSGEQPRDEAIMRLQAAITGHAVEVASQGAGKMVWDSSSVGPMLDTVQETLSHLNELSEKATQEIQACRHKWQSLVEII